MRRNPLEAALTALPPKAGARPSMREALDYQVEAARKVNQDRELDALDTARLLVAREHSFRDWDDAVAHGDLAIDPRFEAAVDAVIEGDVGALRTRLGEDPSLVRARSAYGHHATLLHYVAANGVEPTRQRSPANALEIADTLLGAGAEPDARSDSYDGKCTTALELLVSSSPPAEVGVQADLVETLCRGGANPDGPDDDGAPLWTAITFSYTRSAERLARCGARLDNLVFAAVVGDVDRVKTFFGDDGRLVPIRGRSGERVGLRGPTLDKSHIVEYALIYAAGHGRRPVVEFLMTKKPDLDVKEPVHGGSALGWARHPHAVSGRPEGSPDIAELLEKARAS